MEVEGVRWENHRRRPERIRGRAQGNVDSTEFGRAEEIFVKTRMMSGKIKQRSRCWGTNTNTHTNEYNGRFKLYTAERE